MDAPQINLQLEPTDYWYFDVAEYWKYVTSNSVENVEENRYIVSNYGRIFDLKNNKRCSEYDFGGYRTASLYANGYHTFLIHRIVAIEFLGRDQDPNKIIVNHKNGIKYCCLVNNLEWVTEEENRNHAYETGLISNYGENATLAKMSDKDALNIMYQLRDGVPIKDIIKTVPDCIMYKSSIVYAILAGKAWTRLAKEHNIIFAKYQKHEDVFSDNDKELIGYMLQNFESYDNILIALGFDINSMNYEDFKFYKHCISQIKCGILYKYIAEKYNLIDLYQGTRSGANTIFSLEELHKACSIFEQGFISYDDVLMKLGLDTSNMSKDERFRYVNALSALRRKKNHHQITSQYNF